MPKIRDILGHVSVEVAARKRECRRDRARAIQKGESCLVVKTGTMGAAYSYCSENAKPMLDGAWQKLGTLYAQLNVKPPWSA